MKVAPFLNCTSKLLAWLASIEETTTLMMVGLFVKLFARISECGTWSTGEPSHLSHHSLIATLLFSPSMAHSHLKESPFEPAAGFDKKKLP